MYEQKILYGSRRLVVFSWRFLKNVNDSYTVALFFSHIVTSTFINFKVEKSPRYQCRLPGLVTKSEMSSRVPHLNKIFLFAKADERASPLYCFLTLREFERYSEKFSVEGNRFPSHWWHL